jgi:hypothetical protein
MSQLLTTSGAIPLARRDQGGTVVRSGSDPVEAHPAGSAGRRSGRLATKARAELLEAELAASYAKGVKQLSDHDWTGAEATFRALLDRRASYRGAEGLFALARHQGRPEEKHEPPPKPPVNKPESPGSTLAREEVERQAPPNQKTSVSAEPRLINKVAPIGGEIGRLAKPTFQHHEKSISPVAPIIGIVVAIVLILIIVAGIRGGGGGTPGGSIATPSIVFASTTPTPTTTPSGSTKPQWTGAQMQLLDSHVVWRDEACEPLDVNDTALKPKLVAAVRCYPKVDRLLKPSHGDPDYLDYLQYSTKSARRSAFTKYVGNPGSGDCWKSAGMETSDDGDKLACFKRGSSRQMVWEGFSDDIFYGIGSKTMSYSHLRVWSNNVSNHGI